MNARISTLRAELRDDAAFVATPTPRLSWTVAAEQPGWVQDEADLTDGTSTVTVTGRDSVLVAWPFTPLTAGESRDVSVRVRSTDRAETTWSDPIRVTAGDGDRRCAVGQVCGILYPPRLLGSDRPAQSRRRGRDERGVVAQLGAQR